MCGFQHIAYTLLLYIFQLDDKSDDDQKRVLDMETSKIADEQKSVDILNMHESNIKVSFVYTYIDS